MYKLILILACIFQLKYAYPQEKNSSKSKSIFENENIVKKNYTGKPFINFSIRNDVKQFSNKNLLGKTVYFNFWFAACVPCMSEMPQLNELYNHFKEDTNFVFISLTFDGVDKIKAIKLKYKIEYDVYAINMKESMLMNPARTFPASIVINKEGIITFYDTGVMGIGLLTTRYFKRKIYPAIKNSLNSL